MSTEQWLLVIALGAVCGLAGQGVRAIIGLKKLKDANDAYKLAIASGQPNPQPPDPFSPSVLLVSLFIGMVAGALAAIGLASATDPKAMCSPVGCNPDIEAVLALVSAGYAGTDFIEGFMSKWLPAA
jgi:putative chitinase